MTATAGRCHKITALLRPWPEMMDKAFSIALHVLLAMASTSLAARLLPPISTSIQGRRRLFLVRFSSSSPPPLPLIPHRHHRGTTRRSASVAFLLLLGGFSNHPNRAYAGNLFDKYIKRKKLDPLETYVPSVILTQEQFKDLEKSLDFEKPQYDISRSLLRSGPAASLRVNIRAVAQYATDDGKGKAASDAVEQCLRALEDLDSLLLRASRKDPTASVESMKSKINIALVALDSLLDTVPLAALDKGKAIADAYRVPSKQIDESRPEGVDPGMKQLEAIL